MAPAPSPQRMGVEVTLDDWDTGEDRVLLRYIQCQLGRGAMNFATSRGLSAATFFPSRAVARDEMAWYSAAAPSTGGVILLTAV